MANKKTKRSRQSVERSRTQGMTREQTKRYHAAKRRKTLRRQRRILLLCLAVIAFLFFLLILRACGVFEERAAETTLTVNADGSITFEEIAAISDASADEVKAFIKDAIKTYNRENKGGRVRLKRIHEKDGTIYVRSVYSDAKVYADFTGLTLFSGTIAEAQADGYDLSDIYASVKEGKKGSVTEISEVLSDKRDSCLIVEQNISVVVPGEICYVTDNATEVDGNAVRIQTGDEKAVTTTAIIYTADAKDNTK